MRKTLMDMRPKMKCNMQHSAITCTCCVSTKCPTQALDTSFSHWIHAFFVCVPGDTMFLIGMLPDANTCAPVEDGGGYS